MYDLCDHYITANIVIFVIFSLTPRMARLGGGTATQPGLRRNIAAEMQHEVLTCPVETFLTHYMPFSPSTKDISRARTALVKSKKLNLNGDKREWRALGGINPSSSAKKETEVFGSLQGIVNSLLSLGSVDSVSAPTLHERRQPGFRYHNCLMTLFMASHWAAGHSSWMPVSDRMRLNQVQSCHPMQLLLLSSKRMMARLFKVYVHATDVKALQLTLTQNRQQLLSAANYIMNDDPCRMWMYGVRVFLNGPTLCQCSPVIISQSRTIRCRSGTSRVPTLSSRKHLIGLR